MPYSEPPGPFVASKEDGDAPPQLPMHKREPWLIALSALLVAAAAFVLMRGVVPHATAPRVHAAATTVAPRALEDEARTRYAQFEPVATSWTETSALEPPSTQPVQALQPTPEPATKPREKPELAPRHAPLKSTGTEPLGTLDVTSNSPSGLVLDGRPLGKSPRVVQLPAGLHTVLFIHPDRGRMSVTVNVRAGRTTTAAANF